MLAKDVARILTEKGLKVLSFQEGDEVEDGDVVLSETIHVQIPTFGGYPNIVVERDDGCFQFFPPRKHVDVLVRDLISLGVN